MKLSRIEIPVAPGELIDKLTILDIKSERISDAEKLANIHRERELLEQAWVDAGGAEHDIADARSRLKEVNERLWEIEDEIRKCEARGEFDAGFIELARSVYLNNDERAALKRSINEQLGSSIMEEKSYAPYR